ncbi:MAG: TadE/TadG family type IV pilus assembly protein [Aggregatilineales bacterium]
MMIKRRSTRKFKGQAIVEFALVMPQVLLMLMGVIEFGWLVFNYTQIYNGLRESLRYGSVPSFSTTPAYEDCAGIRAAIEGTAPNLGVTDAEITIRYDQGYYGAASTFVADCNGSGGAFEFLNGNTAIQAGDRTEIIINHQTKFLTPFISTLAPGGFQMYFEAARSIYP